GGRREGRAERPDRSLRPAAGSGPPRVAQSVAAASDSGTAEPGGDALAVARFGAAGAVRSAGRAGRDPGATEARGQRPLRPLRATQRSNVVRQRVLQGRGVLLRGLRRPRQDVLLKRALARRASKEPLLSPTRQRG